MATMIVRHKVADFNNWKKVFDSMHEVRHSHGWIGHEVLRDAADSNMVTIINKMKTVEGADSYRLSPELKEGMQNAGVISTPEIFITNDEEIYSY